MSAMLLEKNGNKSSTKNTKYINMCYYFIKDWVETGDVVIEYFPTEKMLVPTRCTIQKIQGRNNEHTR